MDTAGSPSVITDSSTVRALYPAYLREGAMGRRIRQTLVTSKCNGRDSIVRIATRYGLDGPGIKSRWEERFSTSVQIIPEAHPPSCKMGTGSHCCG
jgi:hypothetical protein